MFNKGTIISLHEPYAAERGPPELKRVPYASQVDSCTFPNLAERHVENLGVKNVITTIEMEVVLLVNKI